MADSVVFTFPIPLQQENLVSASAQVIRVLSEPEKRYFLSALVCLLRFAIDKLNDGQNVNLAIAKKTEESDSDEQWQKQRVWVKVKTTGGSAPRVNYMATCFGISQIDWKNNTRIFLGAIPEVIVIDVLEKYASGTLFSDFSGRKRLFQRSMSLQTDTRALTAFGDILTMHPCTVAEIVVNPARLHQVAAELFQIFDEDSSGGMDHKEFLKFFSHFLHLPLSICLEIFQDLAQPDGTIGLKEFERIFERFLRNWFSTESGNELLFFWNKLTNGLANHPTLEARMIVADNEKILEDLLQRIPQRYRMGTAVSWELYQQLSTNLDKALYRPVTATVKLREKFNEIAEDGKVPVKQYVKEMKKAMHEIIDFLTDWDNVISVRKSVPYTTREEALAFYSNAEAVKEMVRRLFQCFGAKESLNYEQLIRYVRCSNVPSVVTLTEEQKHEVNFTVIDALRVFQVFKKTVAAEGHPGRSEFLELTNKKPEELMALTIEEYRLKAIAYDIFSDVFPIREAHDFDTFKTYANAMCEVFQVENAEEAVRSLFAHYNTSGVITQSDLVLVLKQMIGHQMKWAKSKEIEERMKKEQLRQILHNPEALRAMAQDLFTTADANRDGWIDRSELKQAMRIVVGSEETPFAKTDEEVNALFDRLDTNHDGKLSLEEYQVFIVGSLEAYVNS